MPVRRSCVIFVKCAIVTLVLLFVVPPQAKKPSRQKAEEGHSFYGRTISCVLGLGKGTEGRLDAGFNYELLRMFAEQNGSTLSVRIASSDGNYADSLALGTVDILIAYDDWKSGNGDGTIHTRDVGEGCVWYMGPESTEEMKTVNLWLASIMGTEEYKELKTRFGRTYNPYRRAERGDISSRLSPYDELIRASAAELGWDWRLLVAVVYQESKFAINTVSRRGATGLMQVMPSTMLRYGVTDAVDPEQNLLAGTLHLSQIQKIFPQEEFSPSERVKFTLAAYNAGEGRIVDCRLLAKKRGIDSTKWNEAIKVIPEMDEYTVGTADSTRTRSFKGTETIEYVSKVMELYSLLCEICPEE